jgi:DNA-binding NtrC family response regulator
MDLQQVTILLIEDNKDFAKLVQVYLQRFEHDRFSIVWRENYDDAMSELVSNASIDVILMDYFLPGKNGVEIAAEIMEKRPELPIIFLSVNKDFDLVLKVMKLGVADYIVKEEISSPILPKTILNVIEKKRLHQQLMQVEISKHRVKVMRELLATVLNDLERPLVEMRRVSGELQTEYAEQANKNFTKIIEDNVNRVWDKLEKLKSLKEDKTIPYIKDIRMIDLS